MYVNTLLGKVFGSCLSVAKNQAQNRFFVCDSVLGVQQIKDVVCYQGVGAAAPDRLFSAPERLFFLPQTVPTIRYFPGL